MSYFFIVLTHMIVSVRLLEPFLVNFLPDPSLWERAHWFDSVLFLTGQQYARRQKEVRVHRGKLELQRKVFFELHRQLSAFELVDS